MTRATPTRIDDELGLVRYCRGCDEEWPQDAEFWYIQARPAGTYASRLNGKTYLRRTDQSVYYCRACHSDRQRTNHHRRKAS